MSYPGPKVRLARQVGVAITPKSAKYLERKPYPPGQHGQRRAGRPSEYKRQLLEKQRLRYQYDVSERQLANAFHAATRRPGTTGEELLADLELRLVSAVLRAGFARSIYAARQYVSHGHILVNGRRVNLPAYRLRPSDVVAVKPRSRQFLCFQEALQTSGEPPAYLEVDRGEFRATVLRRPDRDEIPVTCEESAVVEFYSR